LETIKPFQYYSPESLDKALSLLAEKGVQAKILAGGTDLLVMMKDRILTPEYVIDLKSIPGMDQIIWDDEDCLVIGALVKVSDVISSTIIQEKFPSIYQGARQLGTPQLRNMATVAGNICRSSPSADLIPALLVLDATVALCSQEGKRIVLLDDFITGPGKNILKDEILTEIIIPPDKRLYETGFLKLGRLSEDLAKVNCAVKMIVRDGKFEEIRIALGAVAPRVVRARSVEKALLGKAPDPEEIHRATKLVEKDISPITDVRSTADYRLQTSRVIIERLINKLLKEGKIT
jgi:carbon-monoxide dehydrogenase medium subunit